jgi:hypothetical protein
VVAVVGHVQADDAGDAFAASGGSPCATLTDLTMRAGLSTEL